MLPPIALFLGLAHLAVITSCRPLNRWQDLVVKHSWNEIPRGWECKGPAPAHYVFELKIGMKQPRIDELFASLMKISDPEHARYAEHLNREQVEQLTAPHPDSSQVIDEWVAFHGIIPCSDFVHRSKAGDWVTVRVTVEQAERMLGTKYHVYKHLGSGDQVIRTLSYSLPEELLSHIDVVSPTTYFGTLQTMKTISSINSVTPITSPIGGDFQPEEVCENLSSPKCIRWLYNFTDEYTIPSQPNNALGVAGFLGEHASQDDLQLFLADYSSNATGHSNFTIVSISNGENETHSGTLEANLDTQVVAGLTNSTSIIFYSTGGSPQIVHDYTEPNPINTNEPYLEFLQYLSGLHDPDIPQVLTISYGENEQTVPEDYARRVCDQFAALGTRGTSIIVSSGDYGVGEGNCMTNDGKNQTLFQPAFPASCPFVTAVGGTAQSNPEVAAKFSGGGFSRYFKRPDYQNEDVGNFISKSNQVYKDMYNGSGRAYPDISARSLNFPVYVNGSVGYLSGTSASSPTVAAIFSSLNDRRLNASKPALGFLNPYIYKQLKSGFNNITSGSNGGCGTDGFTADVGWNPVTGLGTPNFPRLAKLVDELK